MLQRNSTPYPFTFTGDAPHTVLPGETADYPVLLDGWTPAAEEAPATEAEPAKTTKSKRTAAADTPEGGEPQ